MFLIPLETKYNLTKLKLYQIDYVEEEFVVKNDINCLTSAFLFLNRIYFIKKTKLMGILYD